MERNEITAEQFNAAVIARFQADKQAEWDRLEQEDWETAHGMYNDTMGYMQWKQQHRCQEYADYSGSCCAVCGAALNEQVSD